MSACRQPAPLNITGNIRPRPNDAAIHALAELILLASLPQALEPSTSTAQASFHEAAPSLPPTRWGAAEGGWSE